MYRFVIFVDGSNLAGALRRMSLRIDNYESVIAHESAAVYLLPGPLKAYLQQHPEIKVGITEAASMRSQPELDIPRPTRMIHGDKRYLSDAARAFIDTVSRFDYDTVVNPAPVRARLGVHAGGQRSSRLSPSR
jgi:hypothetical protein